jgi:uncharacterized protein YlbG (UPF0298 family)
MFQMQQEHRLALAKNYVLLVNETPVDDILDELRQQQIVRRFTLSAMLCWPVTRTSWYLC